MTYEKLPRKTKSEVKFLLNFFSKVFVFQLPLDENEWTVSTENPNIDNEFEVLHSQFDESELERELKP